MVNLRIILKLVAWAGLVLVAIAALAPIEFRPTTSSLSPPIERFGAFAAVGLAFALAYPRQFWLAALLVIGAAVVIEMLQVLAPSRHGRPADALVKVAGAAAGLFVGRIFLSWQRRRAQSAERN